MPDKFNISPPQRMPTKSEVGLAHHKPHGQAPNDFKPCSGNFKNVGSSRGPTVAVTQNPGMHKMKY